MDRLVVSAGTVVVHGHGVGGGLGFGGCGGGVGGGVGVAKERGVVQALLLACGQTGAQSFATGHGIAVEATRESVFVSPRDGGVFFGQAEVGAGGRLTVVTRVVPEALERFVPGGDGGPVVVDRPLVVGLSWEEVLAHPGPWVRRLGGSGGLDRAQPAVPETLTSWLDQAMAGLPVQPLLFVDGQPQGTSAQLAGAVTATGADAGGEGGPASRRIDRSSTSRPTRGRTRRRRLQPCRRRRLGTYLLGATTTAGASAARAGTPGYGFAGGFGGLRRGARRTTTHHVAHRCRNQNAQLK